MASAGEAPSLRRATFDDVTALGDLLEAVGAEGLWIATEPPLDRRRFGFQIRPFIQDDRHVCLVIPHADGMLAGELTAWPDGAHSVSIGMCVARDVRRRGIGTALLAGCVSWARQHAVARVNLKVFPHNHAARALYVKFGFVETGLEAASITRRNGERWDAILMSLRL